MAKKVYEKKFECFNSNKNKTGSTVTLAANVQQTDKGPATRTAVNILDPDLEIATNFKPGKKYTVTITEE